MRKNLVDMNVMVEQAAVVDGRIVERNPHRERRVGVIRTEIEIILMNRLGASHLWRLHENLAEEDGNAGADQLMNHLNQIPVAGHLSKNLSIMNWVIELTQQRLLAAGFQIPSSLRIGQ